MTLEIKLHNGLYTIRNWETNAHGYFQVRTIRTEGSPLKGKRTVGYCAAERGGQYTYFGFVTEDGIKVWQKRSASVTGSDLYEKLARMLWDIAVKKEQGWMVARGYETHLQGCCARCNRRLKDPSSIVSGIGPECAEKWNQEYIKSRCHKSLA